MKHTKMKGLLAKQKILCTNKLKIIEIILENVGGKTPPHPYGWVIWSIAKWKGIGF
jgi:hypothetical protein